MFSEQQNKEVNDIRASLTQGIDTLKSGETMIAEVQTRLQAFQESVGVAAPVDTTPSEEGTLTKAQAAQMVADAIAARDAADTTIYTEVDLAKQKTALDAAHAESVAKLIARIAELEKATPGAIDQDAAQEAIADEMATLVQKIRDLTVKAVPSEPKA